MKLLSVAPRSEADIGNAEFLGWYSKRVAATPPGTCPIALQTALVEAGVMQSCGKCVPCRDGLPQLAELLRQVRDCKADRATIEKIRSLAAMVRDTSDCVIGYGVGIMVSDSLKVFEKEFESHIENGRCTEGVGQTIPCETLCPAHVNIPGYIALTQRGDYAGAVNMIRKDNPFPTACAFVCEHPCERSCRRKILDAPINIRGIKRYAVDQAPADTVATPKALAATDRRIAVIGGGPGGLTAAYFLALMGHEVVVYEGRRKLGGMMRYAIPPYRFPRERLDQDIAGILSAGNIKVELEHHVDAEEFTRITKEFDAVHISIGAQVGKKLGIENDDAQGVMSAVELLGMLGEEPEAFPDFSGKNVVVIGGGNVAMDAARSSIRLGAETVSVVYRRRMEDMTALDEEIESALAEGAEMCMLEAPVRIEVDDAGRCCALITQPQMIGPVKRGRPAPMDSSRPQKRFPADIILIAIGQDIVTEPFEKFGLKVGRKGFVASENLIAEGFDNVFVGGDCYSGPATVIKAIAAGKVAARNIDTFLGFHHRLDPEVTAPSATENDPTPTGRVNMVERPARERRCDFDGVEVEMTREEAMQECARCLRCDHFGCGITERGRVQYV